jgi:2-amino-4-hydroxy-6-hydroxymethyldihydropteridine diphosphokinase
LHFFATSLAVAEVYLLLGSNMGDREHTLGKARSRISRALGEVTAASGVYETAAWGKTDQDPFLNQVIRLKTNLDPQSLLQKAQEMEKELGRVRKEKWAARVVDLDILFYAQQVVQTPELTIPHPELHNRRFTLVPLAELAPGLVHPVLHKTVRELLRDCPDELEVKRLN